MTSRLLGLNSATGNFEYITTDDTGALIVSQGDKGFNTVQIAIDASFGSTGNSNVAPTSTVIGSVVDTTGYTYLNAFIDCPWGISSGGSIALQYSFDNNLWFNSSESTYLSPGGGAQNGLIRGYSPIPSQYARLNALNGFAASNVSAYITLR